MLPSDNGHHPQVRPPIPIPPYPTQQHPLVRPTPPVPNATPSSALPPSGSPIIHPTPTLPQFTPLPPPTISHTVLPIASGSRPPAKLVTPIALPRPPPPPSRSSGGPSPLAPPASIPTTGGPPTARPPPLPIKRTKTTVPDRPRTGMEKILQYGLQMNVNLALYQDQYSTLYPDVSAFRDSRDVIDRLVPYHIWQIPEDAQREKRLEDLARNKDKGKGKGRAREWDFEELIEENEEEERARLKEAIAFAKRRKSLEQRFLSTRQAEGKHASPRPQAVFLARDSTQDAIRSRAMTKSTVAKAQERLTLLQRRLKEAAALSIEPSPPPQIDPPTFRPIAQAPRPSVLAGPVLPSFSIPTAPTLSYAPTPGLGLVRPPPFPSHLSFKNQLPPYAPAGPVPASSHSSIPRPIAPPPLNVSVRPPQGGPPNMDPNGYSSIILPIHCITRLVQLGVLPDGTPESVEAVRARLGTKDIKVDNERVGFKVPLRKMTREQVEGLKAMIAPLAAAAGVGGASGPGPGPGPSRGSTGSGRP